MWSAAPSVLPHSQPQMGTHLVGGLGSAELTAPRMGEPTPSPHRSGLQDPQALNPPQGDQTSGAPPSGCPLSGYPLRHAHSLLPPQCSCAGWGWWGPPLWPACCGPDMGMLVGSCVKHGPWGWPVCWVGCRIQDPCCPRRSGALWGLRLRGCRA